LKARKGRRRAFYSAYVAELSSGGAGIKEYLMAEEEKKEQQEVKAAPEGETKPPESSQAGETLNVSRAALDELLEKALDRGRREMQGAKDKEVAEKDQTIAQFQLLHNLQDMTEEELQALKDMADYSRRLANEAGKARGLGKTEIGYLSIFPHTRLQAEADRMQAESATAKEEQKRSLLEELAPSLAGTTTKGSADVTLTATAGLSGGQREPSNDAGLLDRYLDPTATPEQRARAGELLTQRGLLR